MAELTLPANSKIKRNGRVNKAAEGATRVKNFKVYRYDPDSGENPRYDDFEVDLDIRLLLTFYIRGFRPRNLSYSQELQSLGFGSCLQVFEHGRDVSRFRHSLFQMKDNRLSLLELCRTISNLVSELPFTFQFRLESIELLLSFT